MKFLLPLPFYVDISRVFPRHPTSSLNEWLENNVGIRASRASYGDPVMADGAWIAVIHSLEITRYFFRTEKDAILFKLRFG